MLSLQHNLMLPNKRVASTEALASSVDKLWMPKKPLVKPRNSWTCISKCFKKGALHPHQFWHCLLFAAGSDDISEAVRCFETGTYFDGENTAAMPELV